MATTDCTAPQQIATAPTVVNPASTDPSSLTNAAGCTAPAIMTSNPTPATPTQPSQIRNTYDEFINMYKQANGFADGGLVQNFATGGTPQPTTNPYCITPGSVCFKATDNPMPIQKVAGSVFECTYCEGLAYAGMLPYVGQFINAFTCQTVVQTCHNPKHPGPYSPGCIRGVCYYNGTSGTCGIKNYSTTPYFACQPGKKYVNLCSPCYCYYYCTPYSNPKTTLAGCEVQINGQNWAPVGACWTCSPLQTQCYYLEYNKYSCVLGFDGSTAAGSWIPPWEGGNTFCPWATSVGTICHPHGSAQFTPGTYNNYPQLGQAWWQAPPATAQCNGGTGVAVLSPTTVCNSGAPTGTTGTGTGSTPQATCGTASAAGVPVTTPTANSQILGIEQQNASNPQLPPGTQDNVQLIKNSACQMLCSGGYAVNAPNITPTTGGTAQTVANQPGINTNTYQAAQTCPAFTIKPAQGQVDQCAIVSNQLQKLTCFKNGTPGWAQPAINAANSLMAARGLGNSTIAGGAFINSIEQAALPVATANAQYFANLDTQNLTNEQQATITSAQLNAQALLSNTAATNAALQFNAQSANQTEQFMANLNSQIQLTNAAQVNAMQQFNAGQLNSVAEFNANMANNVAQFNAQNRLAIDQSNVTWRRNINTLNTASVNAANQVNAQNLFNLSATAQNNLWQEMQDQASWANTDAQNALTRAQNMAIASLGVQTAFNLQSSAQQAALMQYLGSFGLNVATSAIGSFFSSTPSTPDNSCIPGEKPSITDNQINLLDQENGIDPNDNGEM